MGADQSSRPEALVCIECGTGFVRPGERGPVPTRCASCKQQRKRVKHAAQEAAREARRKAGTYRCGRCKTDRPGEDFARTARRDGGWCNDCLRATYVARSGGLIEKACAHCGGTFKVTRRGERKNYCSRPCKDAAGRERKRLALIAEKTANPDHCLNCGIAFPPDSRRDRRYCDGACSHEHNAERRALIRRRSMLRRTYGITLEQYDAILHNQGGRCAICHTDDPGLKGVFHVDHCHHEGHVRGLLCSACNTGLGHFKDDVTRLVRAVNYVARARDGILPDVGPT